MSRNRGWAGGVDARSALCSNGGFSPAGACAPVSGPNMKRTYQASKVRRARTHGFPVRMKTPGGRAVLASRALGMVVPKRHARRAVTRSLLKRELRAAWLRRAQLLEPGAWLLRLRAGFETARFPSAASRPLHAAVRAEIEQLLDRCV